VPRARERSIHACISTLIQLHFYFASKRHLPGKSVTTICAELVYLSLQSLHERERQAYHVLY